MLRLDKKYTLKVTVRAGIEIKRYVNKMEITGQTEMNEMRI